MLGRPVRDRDDDPIDTPPEGASCGEHPDRDALYVCPRCSAFCCLVCWHSSVRRCHACLMKDPGPPVPWEDRERSLPGRFVATFLDAFRPTRSAPGLVRSAARSSITFALLSFVPLALLSGVIPWTLTLRFGPTWEVGLIGAPSTGDIAIDVARAGGVGLAICLALLLVVLVPYHSLSRAYGENGHPGAPTALLLYRGWLIPTSQIVQYLVIWSLPENPSSSAELFIQMAALVPIVLLFYAMLATARMASGVGPVLAMIVVLVPIALFAFVREVGQDRLSPLMPHPETPPAQTASNR
jgi:hypothetical protein